MQHPLLECIQPFVKLQGKCGKLVYSELINGCSARIGSLPSCGWTEPAWRTALRAALGTRRNVIRNPVV